MASTRAELRYGASADHELSMSAKSHIHTNVLGNGGAAYDIQRPPFGKGSFDQKSDRWWKN